MKRGACSQPSTIKKVQPALFNWSTLKKTKKCLFKFWRNEIFFFFKNFSFWGTFGITLVLGFYAKSTTKSQNFLRTQNSEKKSFYQDSKLHILIFYGWHWGLTSNSRKMQFVDGRRCWRPFLLRFSSRPIWTHPNHISLIQKLKIV